MTHERIVCLALFIYLAILTRPTHAYHGTQRNERLSRNKEAKELYPYYNYTKFESEAHFLAEPEESTAGWNQMNSLIHNLFDSLAPGGAALPPGYISRLGDNNTVNLGPKFELNDWKDLLLRYWVLFFCVFVLLALIIVVPFLAVCYCCIFAYQCSQGCPSCDMRKDDRSRCCWGYILAVLLIGIIFAATICLQSNYLLDTKLQTTAIEVRRRLQNTCTFLRHTSDHISHLLIKNCEEMVTHLIYVINTMHLHKYNYLEKGLGNVTYVNLHRQFANLEEARQLLREVALWEDDVRFYGAQLRDGLRGVKRDIIYALSVLCGNQECLRFLRNSGIQEIDSSKCMHFDKLPDGQYWVQAISDLMATDVLYRCEKITNCVNRFRNDNNGLKTMYDPLKNHANKGRDPFRIEADTLRNIIDGVISDIYMNSQKLTTSFEDIFEKYSTHRSLTNVTVCGLLLFIALFLSIALIFGCCGQRRRGYRDGCFSKGTGAKCMLFAIVFIFCIFSFVVLVGLFYLVLGVVSYMGACAPLRDQERNALFRQVDSLIDLNKYRPRSDIESGTNLQPLRVSKVIKACQANQTIIELLKENDLYDVDKLLNIKVMGDVKIPTERYYDYNVGGYMCFPGAQAHFYDKVVFSTFAPYVGTLFTEFLCTDLTPVPLPTLIAQMKVLRTSLWTQWGIYDWARTSLQNEALNLQRFQDDFIEKVRDLIAKMRQNIKKIDYLILYEGQTFNDSFNYIYETTYSTDRQMRSTVEKLFSEWRLRIPDQLEDHVLEYKKMVIREMKTVGKCEPIADTYSSGVNLICNSIVDPLNGCWASALFGGLLLLPVLFVAHRLKCLYNKIYPMPLPKPLDDIESGCPICTGEAYRQRLDSGVEDPSSPKSNEVNNNGSAAVEQQTTPEASPIELTSPRRRSKRKKEL